MTTHIEVMVTPVPKVVPGQVTLVMDGATALALKDTLGKQNTSYGVYSALWNALQQYQ